MKLTPLILGSLAAAMIAGCNGKRNDAGTTSGGSASESGSMQGGATNAASDTGMSSPGMSNMDTSARSGGGMDTLRGDSARTGSRMHSDTAKGVGTRSGAAGTSGQGKGNQTKSGVTDTKTGKSTLGPGATKTRPDQGQPVTSKGDTISSGPDSGAARQ